MSITHTEVRRHPRWREQLGAAQTAPASTSLGIRLMATAAILIIATAVGVLIFKG